MNPQRKSPVSLSDLASQSKASQGNARFRALAVYAKLLGRRWNVSVVFDPGCKTASTNGKVIKLRPCTIGDDEDAILMEGLIDHEAGVHCRQTNFELASVLLKNEPDLVKVLANVFEDVFGERELKRIKPGCAATINKALEIMTARGIFGPPSSNDPPASLLVGGLVNGLRSRHLGQRILEDFFQQRWNLLEEAVGRPLADELWALANEVESVTCTEEAIELAKKIYATIDTHSQEPPPPPQDGGDDSDPDQGSAKPNEEKEVSQPCEQGPTEQGSQEGPSDGAGDRQDQISESQEGDSQGATSGDPSGTTADRNGSDMDPSQSQAAKDILKASEKESGPGDFADVLSKALGESESADRAAEAGIGAGSAWELGKGSPVESPCADSVVSELARPVAVRLGSKLDELLEAQTNIATDLKRTGRRLHSQRIVQLVTSADSRVFRASDDMIGIDTCMMILTDVSGSMSNLLQGGRVSRINAAAAVTRALGDCLNRFDVPFAVRFFGSRLTPVKNFDGNWRNCRALYWRELEGNTCTDQALLGVIPEIAARQEQRKLLVLVTDGVPSNSSATVLALKEAQRAGVEVATVLVTADGSLSQFASEMQDAGLPAATVASPDELAQRVFEAVRSAF